MPASDGGDQAGRVGMNASYAEQAATNVMSRYGLAAIWELQLLAAKNHREGNELAARSILEIADAAERIWSQWLKEIPDLFA
jgi:hypothetical protein